MRNLYFILLFVVLFSCTKNSSPISNEPEFYFKGRVSNAITGQSERGRTVAVVYGNILGSSIDQIIGFDSVLTDANGNYEIALPWKPASKSYRYFVFVPGFSLPYRLLPPSSQVLSDVLTYSFDGPYSVPNDLADSVKIVENAISTTNFEVYAAGKIHIQFPYTIVPATDSIAIKTSCIDFELPIPNNIVSAKILKHGDDVSAGLQLPAFAGKQMKITSYVRTVGNQLKIITDTLSIGTGETVSYELKY